MNEQLSRHCQAVFPRLALAIVAVVVVAKAEIPPGFGKDTMIRICGHCHSPERAASQHQSRGAWEDTVAKMLKLGAQGSDEELDELLTYLTTNYGPQKPPPLNINTANMVDLQTTLVLRRSQARAVLEYRRVNGDFKSLDDLRKVPGLDFAKLESRKSNIVF